VKSEVDLPEPRPRRRFVQDVLVCGSAAGVVGAVVSALFAIATAAVLGHDPLLPLELVAGTIYRGYSLAELGPGAAFWGFVLLAGAAGGAGVTFALLLPRGGTAIAGLFLAIGFGLIGYVGFVELGLWSDPLLEHALPREALFPYVLLLFTCCALVVPFRRGLALVVRR
jgi:hypothetical protein